MADLVHAHTSGRVKGLRMGQPAPLLDLRFHCGPKLMQAHITPILTESVWAASPIWKTASCMIVSAYNYLWLVALLCPVLLWFTFHLLWYLAIMRPTPTPPSTPVLYSGCLKCQEVTVTKVSESLPCDDWDGPWKLVNVPANEIESDISPWSQEKSKPEICIIGKYGDDAYEVAIDPPYFLGLKFRQCRMDDSTQPEEIQKAMYGAYNATRKAHHQWLKHAADEIRSEHHPKIEQVYRDHARLTGLREELARAILIHNIQTSTAAVQRRLAQKLVILFLNLETDYESFDADHYLESNQDDLLESLQLSLPIPIPAERPRRDKAQITSLIRALLKLSGGRGLGGNWQKQIRYINCYDASTL